MFKKGLKKPFFKHTGAIIQECMLRLSLLIRLLENPL